MKTLKTLLVAESILALVLLGFIIYLFITGGLLPTGNIIATPDSENNILPVEIVEPNPNQVFISVVNTVPADSSYTQGIHSDIKVTFSEQIFSSSVNLDTFRITGPNNIALEGIITSDFTKKVWTFNPSDSLKSNTIYTITLTTGIKGISGNTLLKNYVSDFTTYYSSGGGGGGSTSTPITLALTKITLTPTSRNIIVGNTFQLTATGLDQNSNQFNTTINYTSSNSSIANVNSSGFVTTLSIGNTTIIASNGSITNSSLVEVVEAVITSIEFSSESQNISAGNDLQLNVSGYDQNQDSITVLINYTSSNESVATVNSSGFVTTLIPGNTTITASNGSINDTLILNVFEAILTSINLTPSNETLALGNTTQLIAEGFDQFNFPIDGILDYVSNDTSVATVNSTGFVNASGEGTAIITASNGTVSENVTIIVYSPILTKIELIPSSTTLQSGEGIQLNAEGFDQNNNTFLIVIAYNSSNESIATVNSTGFVNVSGVGNATITAFNGSITNTSLIEVLVLSCPAVSVDLGTAGDFAILAKSGISSTIGTLIIGNIGVSPAASTYITGFGLIMDALGQWSTSSLIQSPGKAYASNYADPTPAYLSGTIVDGAVYDMERAYTTAAGLTDCVTELGAGEIGGMTLASGTYKWGTGLLISTDVTLNGTATDVWVFEIAGTLGLANSKEVKLTGGALAKNIYWVVGDVTTLGTTSVMNGNILSGPGVPVDEAIVLNTGATLNGRALSQKAVTLDANAVTIAV